MGPDPVPERGVELIIRPICPDGRQTTFEEAFSKHRYYLTESGTCMRTFHIAQVHIHRDISRDFEDLIGTKGELKSSMVAEADDTGTINTPKGKSNTIKSTPKTDSSIKRTAV